MFCAIIFPFILVSRGQLQKCSSHAGFCMILSRLCICIIFVRSHPLCPKWAAAPWHTGAKSKYAVLMEKLHSGARNADVWVQWFPMSLADRTFDSDGNCMCLCVRLVAKNFSLLASSSSLGVQATFQQLLRGGHCQDGPAPKQGVYIFCLESEHFVGTWFRNTSPLILLF